MSALPSEADMLIVGINVCFVPEADFAMQSLNVRIVPLADIEGASRRAYAIVEIRASRDQRYPRSHLVNQPMIAGPPSDEVGNAS
jgi:hypothetical protein